MLNAKNKSGMHNIAQNYTQVKNTVTNKNSEYIFLNKKKYTTNTHIPFFLEEGVFCIIKRKKIKSQPDKNNKKNAINFHV